MNLHVDRTGGGRDLVLLHGWGLHSGAWDDVMPALAARHRVHAIDLPGHGRSAPVEVASFDEAVEAVVSLVPAGAIVCGWSLGGSIAQAMALRHPGRIAAVALVATTPCFVAREGWPHGMKPETLASFARELAGDRDALLRRFVALNAMQGPDGREATRTFTGRLLARGAPSPRGLAQALEWLRDVDLRAQVPGLALPALVIHGARDMIAPVGAGRWLAANVPGARYVELEGAAHLPFFSHRETFVTALEALDG